MTKLIAFDLEGILVEEEFLVELARTVDKEQEVRKITEDGIKGRINWEEGLKKRIELLKGMDYETIEKLSRKFTINKNAIDIIQTAKSNEFKTAIISGGFKIFAENIMKKLGIDYLIANDFIFEKGKLKGYKLLVNNNKGYWLRKFAEDCKADFTIAIGDGENDIEMLKAADLGILSRGKDLHVFKDAIKNYK